MTILYIDSSLPSGKDFLVLIESTGWEGIAEKGHDKLHEAISKSWSMICAYEGNRLVGSGRILSDGVYQALICDLIVLPEYQGKGIGREILIRLLKKCKENNILMVSLFAAKDKGGYYRKFGFEDRPHDAPGMRWIDKKLEEI